MPSAISLGLIEYSRYNNFFSNVYNHLNCYLNKNRKIYLFEELTLPDKKMSFESMTAQASRHLLSGLMGERLKLPTWFFLMRKYERNTFRDIWGIFGNGSFVEIKKNITQNEWHQNQLANNDFNGSWIMYQRHWRWNNKYFLIKSLDIFRGSQK